MHIVTVISYKIVLLRVVLFCVFFCLEYSEGSEFEKLCLYPPDGQWYRGRVLERKKGLLLYCNTVLNII